MNPVIVNNSDGGWIFENLAHILSGSLWAEISENVGDLNYLLCVDPKIMKNNINSFIPLSSIEIASDKRKLEYSFKSYCVKRPITFVLQTLQEVKLILGSNKNNRWILKYPTGCGGIHHRLIQHASEIPEKWSRPFLLQEFIESIQPEVYRFYCVDRDLFGFNVRRFPSSEISTPWVSHANGAKYNYGEAPNTEAIDVAKLALVATGLYESFGVVDLVKDIRGSWYALEVGTDGIYSYVDRDIENDDLLDEINERLAIAFWKNLGNPPWGKKWKYRE
jgi:hypothetical protein